jgi:GTP pyrophosphokinase
MLEKRLSEIGKTLNDKVINSLMEEFEIFDTKPEEMYFKIGCGLIVLDDLENKLKKYYGINRESYFVISNSDQNNKFVLATCCTPILGESVVGFKSSDGTITVHTRTCSNANSLAAKFGDKIVTVKWDKDLNSGSNYLARVSFKGTDRIGMINDITRVTSKVMNVNIRRINLGTEDGIFDGFIDLYVHDIDDLENLILKLKNIKGIESVARKEL